MDLDTLNALKYGELFKMAKEKLNITKRFSKETLVEKLLEFHKNLLNDDEFVSPDESLNKTVETDTKQTDTDGKNEKPAKKNKAKKKQKRKAKKEEPKLNETFSMDEEEADEVKTEAPVPEPETEKPIKRMRGKRKQRKQTQELSTESEINALKPENTQANNSAIEKNMTDISSIAESEPDTKAQEPPAKKAKRRARKPSKKEENKKVEEPVEISKEEPVKEVKERARKASKKDDDKKVEEPVAISKEEPVKEIKGRARKASKKDDENKVEEPTAVAAPKVEPPKKESAAQKRGRNSRGSLQNASTEAAAEPEQAKPPQNKRLKKSSSFTISPSVSKALTPVVSKTEEKKKTPVPVSAAKPSRLPRKSINFATPAKALATPASSAKKQQPPSASIPRPKVKAPPNFAELHQKQFNKMQSVDEYVEKKKARTEAAKTPAKAPVSNITNTASSTKAPTPKDMKFNFVSGLQKPVFTAKGQVVSEKQRVMATVKENVLNSSVSGRKASLLNASRDLNSSKLSINGKEILRGVRTNRRFELQMQHRNMKN